jgi:hypothetical protein
MDLSLKEINKIKRAYGYPKNSLFFGYILYFPEENEYLKSPISYLNITSYLFSKVPDYSFLFYSHKDALLESQSFVKPVMIGMLFRNEKNQHVHLDGKIVNSVKFNIFKNINL